ncbi:MAG TPA: hypothetical protein VIL37_08230 [Natronosporangium sp.]
MRGKGISYDTGFVRNGVNSWPDFDPAVAERDLRVIRDELHCTAVRVIGGDPERLELVASKAAELGLEVWFSPYPLELTTDQMLELFADCAERAERIRRQGAEVVFVAGAEHCLMNPGFVPGGQFEERVQVLMDRDRAVRLIPEVVARVNEFLADAVKVIRERFGGKVTYAAVPLERPDWTLFDFISVDFYRSAEIADQFVDGVRALVAQGKPVAITEVGCATYRGAPDLGGRALEAAEFDPHSGLPIRLKDAHERDEPGQAEYLREVLAVFDAEGVDSTFVFAFALHGFPHRPDGDPRDDLDLVSYGIVKLAEDGSWQPKAAFAALADSYR